MKDDEDKDEKADKADKGDKAEKAPPKPKGNGQMKLVIVGALALFVALVGAQVAAPLINATIAARSAPPTEEELAAAAAEAEADAAAAAEEEAAAAAVAEEEPADEEPLAPALYTALDPPFVVSFDTEDGSRYLQLTLQAMARDEETIAAVKQHAPAIRNAVLFMLSGYELEVLSTQAGKEELRHALLGATNEILAKNGVEEPVEELYFTSLVVQ
jgi:flagellar FliL protein